MKRINAMPTEQMKCVVLVLVWLNIAVTAIDNDNMVSVVDLDTQRDVFFDKAASGLSWGNTFHKQDYILNHRQSALDGKRSVLLLRVQSQFGNSILLPPGTPYFIGVSSEIECAALCLYVATIVDTDDPSADKPSLQCGGFQYFSTPPTITPAYTKCWPVESWVTGRTYTTDCVGDGDWDGEWTKDYCCSSKCCGAGESMSNCDSTWGYPTRKTQSLYQVFIRTSSVVATTSTVAMTAELELTEDIGSGEFSTPSTNQPSPRSPKRMKTSTSSTLAVHPSTTRDSIGKPTPTYISSTPTPITTTTPTQNPPTSRPTTSLLTIPTTSPTHRATVSPSLIMSTPVSPSPLPTSFPTSLSSSVFDGKGLNADDSLIIVVMAIIIVSLAAILIKLLWTRRRRMCGAKGPKKHVSAIPERSVLEDDLVDFQTLRFTTPKELLPTSTANPFFNNPVYNKLQRNKSTDSWNVSNVNTPAHPHVVVNDNDYTNNVAINTTINNNNNNNVNPTNTNNNNNNTNSSTTNNNNTDHGNEGFHSYEYADTATMPRVVSLDSDSTYSVPSALYSPTNISTISNNTSNNSSSSNNNSNNSNNNNSNNSNSSNNNNSSSSGNNNDSNNTNNTNNTNNNSYSSAYSPPEYDYIHDIVINTIANNNVDLTNTNTSTNTNTTNTNTNTNTNININTNTNTNTNTYEYVDTATVSNDVSLDSDRTYSVPSALYAPTTTSSITTGSSNNNNTNSSSNNNNHTNNNNTNHTNNHGNNNNNNNSSTNNSNNNNNNTNNNNTNNSNAVSQFSQLSAETDMDYEEIGFPIYRDDGYI